MVVLLPFVVLERRRQPSYPSRYTPVSVLELPRLRLSELETRRSWIRREATLLREGGRGERRLKGRVRRLLSLVGEIGGREGLRDGGRGVGETTAGFASAGGGEGGIGGVGRGKSGVW